MLYASPMWKALFILTAFAIAAISERTPDDAFAERYFAVDGPEYTVVTVAQFRRLEPTCERVERKRYPAERLIVNICDR